MTNNTDLIKQGKTSKIYYFLYTTQSTKFEILNSLHLRHGDVYNKKKIKNNPFDLLYKNGYIEKTGDSERGTPIYQSTPKPILDIIEEKLEEQNQILTEFEKWVLTTVLDSDNTRSMVKRHYSVDYNNEIDAYGVILEGYLMTFIISIYLTKNVFSDPSMKLLEPNEDKDRFLDIWECNNQLLSKDEKTMIEMYIPSAELLTGKLAHIFLPKSLHVDQQKSFSNNPRDPDFYTRWAGLPNSLVNKLLPISKRASGFMILLTDVMGTILPIIIVSNRIPLLIQNKKLRDYIKNIHANTYAALKKTPKLQTFLKSGTFYSNL